MRKVLIRQLISSGYALAVTFMIGKWAFAYALYERGYEDVGGEYIMLPMVFYGAYKLFEWLLKVLEARKNGSKEIRSRKNPGI